ncbi:MAG: hypothetical protein H0T46_34870 [Deltaproteobacteria bacterium]|nr:hypothetical protein [Deltaproteobacteria bacterium]
MNCPTAAPLQSGQAAELVLGQPSATTGTPNNPSFSGSTLSSPTGVVAEGGRLWVGDSGNARVLQWNSAPAVNGQSASVAIGQPDLLTGTAGTTQDRTSNGLSFIARAGTKLLLSDTANNRVLIWNGIPTTSGQPADLVLGQTSFTTKASGNGASNLYGPAGIWTDGTRLVVAERFNNRVLIWNTFPTSNGVPADVVLGASGFGTSPFVNPPTASSFRNPDGVAYDGTRLYVADVSNNRVLIWNGLPTTNNKPADVVIGQTGFDISFDNAGAPYPQVNAIGMKGPSGVHVDACGSLYVCDGSNGRVLVYTDVPTSNGAAADAVAGKPNLTAQPNASAPASAAWMNGCSAVTVSGASLYATDTSFNRTLRFALSR